MRIAYFVNLFPNFIETMIYREVGALRARGNDVRTFSIRRPAPVQVPEDARPHVEDTFYILPIGVGRLMAAHLRALRRHPVRYWRVLAEVLGGTHERLRDRVRSLCHFAEGVAVLPVVEAMAVDHLHAHWAVGATTVAMVVSRFLDIPFTFTAHAYDIWRERLLLPEKLRAARMAFTCTDYNRRHLVRTYGVADDKVRVVYHGVDLERFRPREVPPSAVPVILSVGRLVEQKGFDRLVRACARLRDAGIAFRCDIFGEGPLRAALEALVTRLGLEAHVTLQGRAFHDALVQEYARAALFALPCVEAPDSDRDGIPNTLIEAMAMERAVVSTHYSGIPELVTDGVHGLLVEPDDVEGLAASLAALLGDPARRARMGRAGRQRVLAQFSLARSATQLDALFASLVARETPARRSAAHAR